MSCKNLLQVVADVAEYGGRGIDITDAASFAGITRHDCSFKYRITVVTRVKYML